MPWSPAKKRQLRDGLRRWRDSGEANKAAASKRLLGRTEMSPADALVRWSRLKQIQGRLEARRDRLASQGAEERSHPKHRQLNRAADRAMRVKIAAAHAAKVAGEGKDINEGKAMKEAQKLGKKTGRARITNADVAKGERDFIKKQERATVRQKARDLMKKHKGNGAEAAKEAAKDKSHGNAVGKEIVRMSRAEAKAKAGGAPKEDAAMRAWQRGKKGGKFYIGAGGKKVYGES